ncbi:MAG: hypothetical protein EOP22_06195 [Hyphomicrobiales bacterium]|nr:MAG: hypothetical protein EOP22_06195 [Hyphomicrobiales bacterium]
MQVHTMPTAFAETDFSELVASIYDAAVTPALWSDVLNSCREFMGGASADIFAKNVTGRISQLYFTDGRLDEKRALSYFDGMALIDPSNSVQVLGDVEQAVITSQRIDLEDFAKTRFAKEWVAPLGLVDMVVAPIERRGSWSALFGVFRHERDGLGDEGVQRRVTILAPHVRRAINIGNIIGKAQQRADNFRELIDGLAAGVFLVDADGRLLHANANGSALLETSRAIASGQEGTLRLDRTSMRELMPRALRSEPSSVSIETASGERMIAHVLPLTGGARQFAGLGGDAVAALFVQPAEFSPESIPETLERAFDLTPAELRVALATLRHDGVADVAEQLGVAESTVKTHLSRIFAKTDTKRQADIVKLVAAFASPLRTMGAKRQDDHPNG